MIFKWLSTLGFSVCSADLIFHESHFSPYFFHEPTFCQHFYHHWWIVTSQLSAKFAGQPYNRPGKIRIIELSAIQWKHNHTTAKRLQFKSAVNCLGSRKTRILPLVKCLPVIGGGYWLSPPLGTPIPVSLMKMLHLVARPRRNGKS